MFVRSWAPALCCRRFRAPDSSSAAKGSSEAMADTKRASAGATVAVSGRGAYCRNTGLSHPDPWRSWILSPFNTFQPLPAVPMSTSPTSRNLRLRRPGWCAAWRAEQKLLATEALLGKQRRAADAAECCRFIQDHPSVVWCRVDWRSMSHCKMTQQVTKSSPTTIQSGDRYITLPIRQLFT